MKICSDIALLGFNRTEFNGILKQSDSFNNKKNKQTNSTMPLTLTFIRTQWRAFTTTHPLIDQHH